MRGRANRRLPPIGPDHEAGLDGELALRGVGPDASHAPVLFEEAGYVRFHFQLERGVAARMLSQEVKKIPLGHERNEVAMSRRVRKIGDCHFSAADAAADLVNLLVG